MTLFIGDVHGKYGSYKRRIKDQINTIQVGDMGIGFFNPTNGAPMHNPPAATMRRGGHRFIRGNHDNPRVCRMTKAWIPDGTIEGEVMFIGGATSIDKEWRIKDYTWWEDEELSYQELTTVADIYRNQRPRIMVTHDCPESISDLVVVASGRFGKLADECRTRQVFQVMLEAHQPDIWIFGHWHVSWDKQVNGTRFVCLDELEAKEIEVGL